MTSTTRNVVQVNGYANPRFNYPSIRKISHFLLFFPLTMQSVLSRNSSQWFLRRADKLRKAYPLEANLRAAKSSSLCQKTGCLCIQLGNLNSFVALFGGIRSLLISPQDSIHLISFPPCLPPILLLLFIFLFIFSLHFFSRLEDWMFLSRYFFLALRGTWVCLEWWGRGWNIGHYCRKLRGCIRFARSRKIRTRHFLIAPSPRWP